MTAVSDELEPIRHGEHVRRAAQVGDALLDTWFMLGRQLRNLLRQPAWVVFMLTQPMFWLVLYGQLFRRIVDLPGFEEGSYIQFLAPGIVVMTTFFSSVWSGMSMITDLDRGVLERFLATPAARSSLVVSQVVRAGFTGVVQGFVILGTAFLLGARVSHGVGGWVVILALGALVAMGFSGISHGVALILRREETLIAALNFFGLPLTFVSATLIARELMPPWMQWAARFNPVDWGVVAARELASPSTDWASVALYGGLLVAFAVATATFATWAFRIYQRTL